LSNFEIEDIMKNERGWKGVFSKDQLKGKIKKHELGIVNFDDVGGSGTHWVAYFNSPQSKYAYYFDSYGLPPPEEIKKYLKTSGKQIMFNTSMMQQLNSVLCGIYCVDILKKLNRGDDFYEAIHSFDPYPSEENQEKVEELYEKIF